MKKTDIIIGIKDFDLLPFYHSIPKGNVSGVLLDILQSHINKEYKYSFPYALDYQKEYEMKRISMTLYLDHIGYAKVKDKILSLPKSTRSDYIKKIIRLRVPIDLDQEVHVKAPKTDTPSKPKIKISLNNK